MSLFRSITRRILAPIVAPIAVVAIAIVVTASYVQYRTQSDDQQAATYQAPENPRGGPWVGNFCDRYPNHEKCLNDHAVEPRNPSPSPGMQTTEDMQNGPVASCKVESFVKEVTDQGDKAYDELTRIRTALKAIPKATLLNHMLCMRKLNILVKTFESFTREPSNACRNNYDNENAQTVRNINLLAAFNNQFRNNPSCAGILALINGTNSNQNIVNHPSDNSPDSRNPAQVYRNESSSPTANAVK